MTDKPTPEQIQRACDLANEAKGIPDFWFPRDYGQLSVFTALADTIAKLDAMQAERDKAWADLGEIYIQLDGVSGLHRLADDSRQAIEAAHDTAAPYRVETDPLVEAFRAIQDKDIEDGVEWSVDITRRLSAELAKRGLEIGRSA